MSDSLRDQLIKSGLAKRAPETPRVKQRRKPTPTPAPTPVQRPRNTNKPVGADVDLARAYAMRAKVEAREREQARIQAQAQARAREECKRRLKKLIAGKVLNKEDADVARHFEYGGKIRRIHVDNAQLTELNAGRLGVIQLAGRYLLLAAAVVHEVRTFAPDHVALLVDPDAPPVDDGVPDDLVW